jgi:hypothetical protein
MDLYEAIRKLYEEKNRLEQTIQELEKLLAADGTAPRTEASASRRGRRSMGCEERQQVSERMRKYWAGRRKKQPEKD